jgi:DNA modification methylase
MVQTKEQQPIRQPDVDAFLILDRKKERFRQSHPCPKSEEEMEFMVKHLTKPGDIVLDPFAGTGTTLQAAKKLGRHYLGCDISPNYVWLCKLGLKRINNGKM